MNFRPSLRLSSPVQRSDCLSVWWMLQTFTPHAEWISFIFRLRRVKQLCEDEIVLRRRLWMLCFESKHVRKCVVKFRRKFPLTDHANNLCQIFTKYNQNYSPLLLLSLIKTQYQRLDYPERVLKRGPASNLQRQLRFLGCQKSWLNFSRSSRTPVYVIINVEKCYLNPTPRKGPQEKNGPTWIYI